MTDQWMTNVLANAVDRLVADTMNATLDRLAEIFEARAEREPDARVTFSEVAEALRAGMTVEPGSLRA